ncbi:hypothetical protein GLAREA_06377 [Glarea lozoyensis ATCC 20868]|uniref:Apple domain-containing protein n=1 Tax=Glarea lozoyensis (strain ATCC 20868 / MF5171) TaxID=1116229 RepID=S3D8B4_GLAL2|nr:uncharacterized protein GLAREA_06377 [Glarea lozoyensis ATCC 20868]EPE33364.1 hypothetical protein GLAREA_06377 [Glarea lozoyensis ATCC 20868]
MRSVVALGVALLGIGALAVPVDQDISLDARQVLDPGGPSGPGSPMNCLFEYDPGTINPPPENEPINADPVGFCSQYIRSTRTVIRTSYYTNTATVNVPTTVASTRVVTSYYTTVITVTVPATSSVTRTTYTTKPWTSTVTTTTTTTRPSTTSTSTKPTTSSTTSTTTSKPITSPPTTTSKTSTSTTSTTSSSVVVGPTPTDGSVCPTPVAGQICGAKGWGYATNNIYSAQPMEPVICHQLCLKNKDCKSFQVVSNATDVQLCNLYSTDSNSTNIIPGDASPFLFFDRDCPDYVPAACKSSPEPAPEPRKRDENDDIPPPFYFSGIPSETLSDICSCIVTNPVPGTTVTKTTSKGTTTTVAIPKPTTVVTTVVSSVGATSTTEVTKITTVYATQTVTVG